MEFKKSRLQKQFLIIAIGISLASTPFSRSFARENEPLKPAMKTGMASWYHDNFMVVKLLMVMFLARKNLRVRAIKSH